MRRYLGIGIFLASISSSGALAQDADDVQARFSAEFKKMKAEEAGLQRKNLENLIDLYRQDSDTRLSAGQLIALGELTLDTEPAASLTFLHQAENRAGLGIPVLNKIRMLRAKAYYALGSNRASLRELSLLVNRDFSYDAHKASAELELLNLAALDDMASFLNRFEPYAARFPRHTQDDNIVLAAAFFFKTAGRDREHLRLLEGIAEKYPLTAASRKAFHTLQSYACESAQGPRYHFSLAFLRAINWQSSLDPGLDAWITAMSSEPLAQANGEVRRLSLREEIEFLSRLKKFPKLLDKIAAAMRKGGLNEEDASLFGFLRVRALYMQGSFRDAILAADDFSNTYPRNWRTNVVRGFKAHSLGKLGYYPQSAALFADIVQRGGKGSARWQSFWQAYQAKNYQGAYDMLVKNSRSILPDDDATAFDYWRARLLEKLGRHAEAEALLKGIAARYPLSHYSAVTTKPASEKTLALAAEIAPTTEDEATTSDETTVDDELPRQAQASDNDVSMVFTNATKVFLQNTTQTNSRDFQDDVERYAALVGLDSGILMSVMRAESNFNKNALSPVGALGLMQLMPFTAIRIAKELEDESYHHRELLNPRYNIFYGAYYFRRLVDYYDGNFVVAIAAYNAGPTAVNSWIQSCHECRVDEFVDAIPYKETRHYVKRILRYYMQFKEHAADNIAIALTKQLPRGFAEVASMY